MTSIRQIDANRRNALRSTGPKTDDGKNRSREPSGMGLVRKPSLKSPKTLSDYRGFEAAIIADYDPVTAVERELVLRLASLLWRLRRASAIETDLLRIQVEILRDRRRCETYEGIRIHLDAKLWPDQASNVDWAGQSPMQDERIDGQPTIASPIRELTHPFSGRTISTMASSSGWGDEAALWRQIVKTHFILRHRVRHCQCLRL